MLYLKEEKEKWMSSEQPGQSPVISIEHLSKYFGTQKAIDNFSLEVYPGDVFAFLGSNGSGKTTTFRCMLDIYKPDQGTVSIMGKQFSHELSHMVGYLPEERGIYTKSSLIDIFRYFAELRGIEKNKRTEYIEEYLEKVDLYKHRNKKISQLSSGMQQKAQIGIAVLHKPPILILDEPFKGLDPLNRQLFLNLFEEFRQQGTTILYSTHAVEEVQRIANRLVMIKEGKRVLYGTIDEIRNSFGTNTIIVHFHGKLPENPQLYDIRTEHNTAELTPVGKSTPQDVLRYLVEQKADVQEFTIDRPTLNDIFIRVAKQEPAADKEEQSS
jgi:ABC-2 type transport system ATP-binding protein